MRNKKQFDPAPTRTVFWRNAGGRSSLQGRDHFDQRKARSGMSQYSSQLRSPEWQKRRLQIMEMAGFKCQRCDEEAKELNVHHIKYRKGADVWDYPNDQLVCLCNQCHKDTHDVLEFFSEFISRADSLTFDSLYGVSKSEKANNCWAWMYLSAILRDFNEKNIESLLSNHNKLVSLGIQIGKARERSSK